MRKLLVCVLMLGLMAGFSGMTAPVVLAQAKKKDKDKDTKKGTKAGAGYIEIGEGKDGKFRFFVRNEDGKLLAMSGGAGFASESDAKKAIEELREVVAKAKVTKAKPKDKDK
jgi:uncharacterized protein YegP (UPF0339 family)